MVGIIGIVATQKNDIDIEKLLPKMCDTIRYRGRHKTDAYIDNNIEAGMNIGIGRVHLGIFNPETQPIFNEDKTKCIIMEGEIYNCQNIKSDLISKGHKFLVDNDPELILHLYEEYGIDFVYKLNGIFSFVIWDKMSGRLLIINDKYGLRPIYYTNNNGYLLFGSEIKAILQDNTFKRIVDDRSVTEFFYFGYILGNKTFFQGIELLPPASIMTYIGGQMSIKQYWDFDFNRIYSDYPENYYIEKLSTLMPQIVNKYMKGNHKIGVLLSGGLDSRTIMASIDKSHYPMHTFTYGKMNCNDAKFAKMISDKLGTIHHYYELKPEDFITHVENVVYMTEGMLNVFYSNFLLSDTLENMSGYTDVVLHGWIGDSTMGDFLNLEHLINVQDDINIFKRLYEPLSVDLKDLFNENYYQIVEKNLDLSKDYISQIGKKVELPANRLIYYNLRERQRRLISVGFIYMRNFLESRTPFSDYEYIDLNLNIHPTFKFNKKLYKKMILAAFPQLKDIPYGATGFPLYKSNFQIKTLQLGRQTLNKITKKIFRLRLFNDEDKSLADYGTWIRTDKNLRDYVLNILSDKKTLERPYFNQKFIRNILESHMCGEKDYSALIGRLLTFELWNRQFIDKLDNDGGYIAEQINDKEVVYLKR